MWIGDAFLVDAPTLDDGATAGVRVSAPLRALWCRDNARVLARVSIMDVSGIDDDGDARLELVDEILEGSAGAPYSQRRARARCTRKANASRASKTTSAT